MPQLILGMASEAFMKFFSGGERLVLSTATIPTSNDNWTGTTIQVDEWVDEISLNYFDTCMVNEEFCIGIFAD